MVYDGAAARLFRNIIVLGLALSSTPALAADPSRAQITQPVDDSRLVTLDGNTRPKP